MYFVCGVISSLCFISRAKLNIAFHCERLCESLCMEVRSLENPFPSKASLPAFLERSVSYEGFSFSIKSSFRVLLLNLVGRQNLCHFPALFYELAMQTIFETTNMNFERMRIASPLRFICWWWCNLISDDDAATRLS